MFFLVSTAGVSVLFYLVLVKWQPPPWVRQLKRRHRHSGKPRQPA